MKIIPIYLIDALICNKKIQSGGGIGSQSGDATVVRFRSREDKKPKHADELAWPK